MTENLKTKTNVKRTQKLQKKMDYISWNGCGNEINEYVYIIFTYIIYIYYIHTSKKFKFCEFFG